MTLTRLALTSSLKKVVILQSERLSAMMETLISDITYALVVVSVTLMNLSTLCRKSGPG